MSNIDHCVKRKFDQNHCQHIRGRVLRRLRAHGVRTHWSDARRLAPTISNTDMAQWFNERFGDDWLKRLRDTEADRRLVTQLIWLIEVRDGYQRRHDVYEVTRINGAIWQTVMAIKNNAKTRG